MVLRAPVAVPIEIRGPDRRVFRLASSIGEDGARLERPVPFEVGRPVSAAFCLPDEEGALAVPARVALAEGDDEGAGCRELTFSDPPEAARAALRRYVTARIEVSGREDG